MRADLSALVQEVRRRAMNPALGDRRTSGRTWAHVVALGLAFGSLLAAACLVGYLGALRGLSEYWGSVGLRILLLGVSLGSAICSWLVWRVAKRLDTHSPDALLATDPRPVTVLLRPFLLDEDPKPHLTVQGTLLLRVGFDVADSWEDAASAELGRYGPVLALAAPRRPTRYPIASRVTCAAEEWQEVVTGLISAASVVMLRPGETPGVEWEIGEAIRVVPPERLAIEFLSSGGRGYANFRESSAARFPGSLPPDPGGPFVLAFEKDWTPLAIPSEGWRDALAAHLATSGIPFRRRPGTAASTRVAQLGFAVAVALSLVLIGSGAWRHVSAWALRLHDSNPLPEFQPPEGPEHDLNTTPIRPTR